MAVTVLNQPTTPNASKTKLVYSITGSNVNQPQYQYVTDIYVSGSSDLLTRFYTYPNLQGTGVVDVARVLDDNLEYDNYWKITGSIEPNQSVKTFDIRFGEAYGSSISSSVTIYTGSTANYLEVFPAIVDANQGSFNFNTSSFADVSASNAFLTNNPAANPSGGGVPNFEYAYIVNSSDYMTLTILKDNVLTPASIGVRGGKIENGSFTFGPLLTIPLSPPEGEFNTIGLGPQNLANLNSTWANGIASGSINAYYTLNDPGGIAVFINDLWDGIPESAGNLQLSNVKQPLKQCSDEYTRFAFINKYGFWDYYNIYNPTRKVVDVDRQIYEENYVDYSSIQSIYSITNRGEKQYNTGYTDRFEITTDYIDGPTANWLTEMFDSPDVYIQSGNNFIPIIINNTQYDWNTNENRQKLFQYTIQYQLANKRYDR